VEVAKASFARNWKQLLAAYVQQSSLGTQLLYNIRS
jgi:hypothetical protein